VFHATLRRGVETFHETGTGPIRLGPMRSLKRCVAPTPRPNEETLRRPQQSLVSAAPVRGRAGDMREKLCHAVVPSVCYRGQRIGGPRPVRHSWHVPVC
jgi:hypothetical protein